MKLNDALVYHRYRPQLTGEGIRLAVFEIYSEMDSPVFMSDNPEYLHDNMVYNLIHHMVPDADIVVLPNTNQGFDWAIDNNVDIAVMSINDALTYGGRQKRLAERTLLITSGGNAGVGGESHAASRDDYWIAVGAAELKNDLPVMESYSSYGKGHIDTVALTDFYLDGLRTWGTSGAAPMLGALMAQYYQMHQEVLGYKPSVATARRFIRENSHDFDHDGKDLKSGYGIFRLPKAFEFEDVTLSTGRQSVTTRTFVDGDLVEVDEEPTTVEPYVEDGRMRVGIRDLEKLGLTVYYDSKTKTVHITG